MRSPTRRRSGMPAEHVAPGRGAEFPGLTSLSSPGTRRPRWSRRVGPSCAGGNRQGARHPWGDEAGRTTTAGVVGREPGMDSGVPRTPRTARAAPGSRGCPALSRRRSSATSTRASSGTWPRIRRRGHHRVARPNPDNRTHWWPRVQRAPDHPSPWQHPSRPLSRTRTRPRMASPSPGRARRRQPATKGDGSCDEVGSRRRGPGRGRDVPLKQRAARQVSRPPNSPNPVGDNPTRRRRPTAGGPERTSGWRRSSIHPAYAPVPSAPRHWS